MQRLHIVIDQSLDPIYGCVQGAHAVAQYVLDNQESSWRNDYLIFLKGDLDRVTEKLSTHQIDYTQFQEPDLDNKLTAIAVLGNERFFKKLSLI